MRRTVLGQAADDDLAAGFRCIHSQPGARRAVRAAQLRHVFHNRIEQIDRHDHVALRLLVIDVLFHEQRADAEQAAVVSHYRRPAPLRMRGRSEQGFVEHILPVAGELAFVDDFRFQCMRTSAGTDDDDVVADCAGAGTAARQRRHAQAA